MLVVFKEFWRQVEVGLLYDYLYINIEIGGMKKYFPLLILIHRILWVWSLLYESSEQTEFKCLSDCI